MNKHKHIKPHNTSIVFTGYNIVEYLQLAVYSFLDMYPEFKSSIVIFNDNSTDDTENWCKKEGFKIISWTKKNYLSDFKGYDNVITTLKERREREKCVLNASYRNSGIIQEIFKQIDTKYLLLNDGDILFMNPGFLEEYDFYVNRGFKVLAPYEQYNYGWKHFTKYFTQKMKDKFLGKYKRFYHYDENTHKEYMHRLHFFHALFDLQELKQHDILFDDLYDQDFIRLIFNHATLETGSSFCLQLEEKEIPTYILPTQKFYNDWQTKENAGFYRPCTEKKAKEIWVYHFRWISSFRRIRDDLKKLEMNSHIWKKIRDDIKYNNVLTDHIMYIVNKYNTIFPKEIFYD